MIAVRFMFGLRSGSRSLRLTHLARTPADVLEGRSDVWMARGTPCRVLSGAGLLVGVLFRNGEPGRLEGASVAVPSRGIADVARFLLRNYWGAYIAILGEEELCAPAFLTDPSGLLPVFSCRRGDRTFLTSDPSLLTPKVSYNAVATHLQRPELRQKNTCLEGVTELVPGAVTTLSRDHSHFPGWEPRGFLSGKSFRDFREAGEELRHTSVTTLQCWSKLLGKSVVAISGGVDSSLVAAALHQARGDFECATVTTRDRSGDEQCFAAAVAERLRVSLTVGRYDPALFDPTLSASRGLPRPSRRAFLTVLDRELERARTHAGAATVLDGNNGDNLFCYLHSSAPVFDRLREEGPGTGAIATLLDICRVTGCSLPVMLSALARRIVAASPTDPWPADNRLLAEAACPKMYEPLVSWLQTAGKRRTGKDDHLRLLMRAQNHVHGVAGPHKRFSPLASQPLVELCLCIPTWIWCQGGLNRSPARAAFARELPAAVGSRTAKYGPDSYIRDAFSLNRRSIRERLLDGLLSANRVIDRLAVERALAVDEVTDLQIVDRLLDLLEAENWSRSWHS